MAVWKKHFSDKKEAIVNEIQLKCPVFYKYYSNVQEKLDDILDKKKTRAALYMIIYFTSNYLLPKFTKDENVAKNISNFLINLLFGENYLD
jgi:hypothetical protein